MNPIKLSKQLQETLISYLTTTFDVNRDGKEPELARFIQRSFNRPRALFAGPYLELTAPYETAESLQELAKAGVIDPRLLQMPCFKEGRPLPIDASLYTHQAAALRKLCAEKSNIVVSSGTGSGKTECFLIPILNDLIVDPTPGVRAVLIYPLNALVNDQLDRLRVLLRGTGITFGRYTSELENSAARARKQMEKEWDEMEPARRKLFDDYQYPLPNEIIGRDQIREQEQLPQILITNYAMLEYLLLRPQDSALFNQGKWRFVVLDEAHSYAGAQGIEIGLLMRRLKHRLGMKPGEMRCIATSATLTDDDAEDAQKFAEALFGEKFTKDDVIFGEPNHHYVTPASPRRPPSTAYVQEKFDSLLDNVRQEKWDSVEDMALLMEEIGLIQAEDLSLADEVSDAPRFLWEVLRGNEDLTRLRQYMVDRGQPVEVTAVAHEIFPDLTDDQQAEALYHLIELAAMARPAAEEPSLLPARYHLFVRPPQGVWVCLNPTCPSKTGEQAWSRFFGEPRETCKDCDSPVYPLVVCRTCGQVYVRLQQVGKQYLAEAPFEVDPQKQYAVWQHTHSNRALGEDEEDDEDILIEQANESTLKQDEMKLCLICQQEVKPTGRCGCKEPSAQVTTLYVLKKEQRDKRKGRQPEVVEHMNECGRCHSRALKSTEIVTEITLNALTPLAILTDDLYRALPASNQKDIQKKAGGGRKLLSFYDSRQGAARFAAFVQDVVNQQAYRRIIREAVESESTSTYWAALRQVCQTASALAITYHIAHNDPDLFPNTTTRNRFSGDEEKQVFEHITKQLLAEITTGLRSRQSLETLGLIAVHYFEPDRLPDFASLADKLGLTIAATRALVEYLLDDLRRNKVVTLPPFVRPDDAVFGRNRFSPRLVRGHDSKAHELAWIGKTPRHRRRQLMRKILAFQGLANDETAVIVALEAILDWLIFESDILDTSRPEAGYQIRHDRLFFQANATWYRCNQCQRLNCRGNLLPCPHAYCDRTLQLLEIDKLEGDNFYYDNLRQRLIPMRIEEHTAQLDPEKGRAYQNQFKSGEINMLSCSTTFEMGIDLGDLQAVVMSNIPPTVANYKQRAGRAGRRTSGTAFIMAWASNRPHDQAYFKTPAEIINGHVRVPYIDVHNPIIIQRHINAILLSEFLRTCAESGSYNKSVGSFFDEQTVGGAYYPSLASWLHEKRDHLLSLLNLFGTSVKQSIDPPIALSIFEQDLRIKGYEHYKRVADYYKNSIQQSLQSQQEMAMQGQISNLTQLSNEMKRYGQLLERLKSEDIINHLSDRGILPSYSFPLHTVELRIPPQLLPTKQLRLQRNLQQAIREYAPGQEVVADKRIWKSEALDYFGKPPEIYAYHICPTCNYLQLADTASKDLDNLDRPCPVCQTFPPRGRWRQNEYIQPDGFRASADSGQAAGQYVDRPFNLMRSSLVPRQVQTRRIGNVLSAGYDRSGALLYVNEGFQGTGFRICPLCGKHVNKRTNKCDGVLNGQPCLGRLERNTTYTLGFRQSTDTLHLKFANIPHISLPDPENISFWLSLKYALLQGASHALQIERQDIDAVLFPESLGQLWQQTIVMYDNVPGGAGHVKRIEDEMKQIVATALEILHCNCETSCYRCLREYANQWEHHLLNRHGVIEFLRALDADLQQSGAAISNWQPVAAVNQVAWFWEKLQQSQQEVILAVERLTLDTPTSEGLTLLDLIQQLLQRNVKVRLLVNRLPDQATGNGEETVLATHLRLLLGKGLEIGQTNRIVPWTAVLDAQTISACAIKTADGRMWAFSKDSDLRFLMVQHIETVNEAYRQMKEYNGRYIEHTDLREPAETTILEVKPDRKRHSEAEYFSGFYAEPVRRMIVSDRYLSDHESILNRLGSHLALANQNGQLESVVVYAREASNRREQMQAVNQLKARFKAMKIEFKMEYHMAHDRYIEVTRANGKKARAIIGHGLGFIKPDGDVCQTFLILQDPIDLT
ncbi:MAG: DEAD/DEAH box helicase [Ardenticatenaceae bacterium]|nr:DEAD/DEAH box helicase [Ardenticatenaceae bacterium]